MSSKNLLIIIWVLAAIALLPLIFQWPVPPPLTGFAQQFVVGLRFPLAFAICYWIYRIERKTLERHQAATVAYFAFLLTAVINNLHGVMVDRGVNFFPNLTNADLQYTLHHAVMILSPTVIPHAYRFLPNCIVRWMELAGINFFAARDIYRMVFGILIFYATYRFARLYINYFGALVSMVLVAAVYPVSFEFYAGQLTDPMSHLSFLLAFIFLSTGAFAPLLTTLLLGTLAKESVIAMAGYYVLFRRKDRNYWWKSAALCLGSLAVCLGIRLAILHVDVKFTNISGLPPNFVLVNLRDSRWPTVTGMTLGAYLPFLLFGWRKIPRELRLLAAFVAAALFLSNLFLSWMHEIRNLMPGVFVLAVVAVRCIGGASVDSGAPGRSRGDKPRR